MCVRTACVELDGPSLKSSCLDLDTNEGPIPVYDYIVPLVVAEGDKNNLFPL